MAASDRCPLSAKADSEEKERSYAKFSRLLTHFADGKKKKIFSLTGMLRIASSSEVFRSSSSGKIQVISRTIIGNGNLQDILNTHLFPSYNLIQEGKYSKLR